MRLILLGLTAVLLSGCISLLSPSTRLPPRYTMTAIEVPSMGVKIPYTLAISDARSEAALNSSRIAVKTAPNEIRYLQDGEWSDRAPRVFSLLLERSFEERGRLLAVSDRVALPVPNYIFFADIQALNVDRTGAEDRAEVIFRARLEDRRGRVLAAQAFEAETPIVGNTTRASAAALNDAAGRSAAEAALWAIELIEADVEGAS